jgi:hypothetical protein
MPLLLVVCEGAVTEPEYLNGFRIAHGANTVRVHVKAPGGDPQALVEAAARLRDDAAQRARREGDDNLGYDEVWCVFDVDEHARLIAGQRLAAAEDIHIAVSNPCFELWLLLHFVEQTGHLDPKRAAALLQKHLRTYEKHVRFGEFAPGYQLAVHRAESLDVQHARVGTQGGNPSTGVYRLTERIRQYGKAARTSNPGDR